MIKTKMVCGREVCEHGYAVAAIQHCKKCSAIIAEKNKPSINDRILSVLNDGQWHTQKQIAEVAGLMDRDGYVDIGRDIRNLRMEENGSHPIDERRHPDDNLVHEYRYLPPDEAPAFWAKRNARMAKQRGGDEIADLKKKLAEAVEELALYKQYTAAVEAENARLKAAAAAAPAVAPASADVKFAPEVVTSAN